GRQELSNIGHSLSKKPGLRNNGRGNGPKRADRAPGFAGPVRLSLQVRTHRPLVWSCLRLLAALPFSLADSLRKSSRPRSGSTSAARTSMPRDPRTAGPFPGFRIDDPKAHVKTRRVRPSLLPVEARATRSGRRPPGRPLRSSLRAAGRDDPHPLTALQAG